MASKHDDKPHAPAAPDPTFGGDPIAHVRALGVVDVQKIPGAPPAYRALDATAKKPILKLTEHQRAEVDDALAEVAANIPQLVTDLGRFAPSEATAKALHERFNGSWAAGRRAAVLHQYCVDQEDVANHDSLTFIIKVQGDILRAAEDDPSVLDRFPKLLALKQQRAEAITVGRARAKATAAEIAAAEGDGTAPKNK